MQSIAHKAKRCIVSSLLPLALLAALAGCGTVDDSSSAADPGPTTADLLDRAVDGIGGCAALTGLRGFALDSNRIRYVMGQGPEPGTGLHRYSMSEGKISHDLAGDRFYGDFIHTGQYVGSKRRVTELVIGQTGYITGFNDFFLQAGAENEAMMPERLATSVKNERLLNPHILLREALTDPSIVSTGDLEISGKRVTSDEIFPITLSRFRATGKRILVTNDKWLARWRGTDYFNAAVEERFMFEASPDWLDSWHKSELDPAADQQLILADDVYPIALHIDSETGRIHKLATMEFDYVYGDVPVEVTYHDWRSVRGVDFPHHIRISLAGAPSMEVRRSNLVGNPEFDAATFTAPTDVSYEHDEARAARGKRLSQTIQAYSYAAAARARAVVKPEIESRELQPGIHLVLPTPSDATYTLVVEQSDGIVVVEPGMEDKKGEAVLDWIAERFGSKPITHIIVSHAHADHATGVRSYASVGATAVVHEAAAEYTRILFARPKSKIMPDLLDQSGAQAKVIGVPADRTYRIEDEKNPVVVYPVVNRHTSDMVMAGVEGSGVLYLGDLYIGALARMLKRGITTSPTGEPVFSAIELADSIAAHGLSPTLMVGSHDAEPVSFADFQTYLAN